MKSRCWSVFAFAILLALGASGIRPAAAATDEEIMATAQQKIADINRQIAGTKDPEQRIALQKQLISTLDDAVKQVSPQLRPILMVTLKVVQPLQTKSAAYQEASSHFFQGDKGNVTTIKSRDDIADRLATIDQLATQNRKLLASVNSFEHDAEQMLIDEGVSQADREQFLEGVRNSAGRRMGAMRALRGIEAAMYTQWKAALTLLDQQWGKWHVSEKGTVLFDDKKAAADYSAIAKQVHTLIQRQQAAEQAVFQPK